MPIMAAERSEETASVARRGLDVAPREPLATARSARAEGKGSAGATSTSEARAR